MKSSTSCSTQRTALLTMRIGFGNLDHGQPQYGAAGGRSITREEDRNENPKRA